MGDRKEYIFADEDGHGIHVHDRRVYNQIGIFCATCDAWLEVDKDLLSGRVQIKGIVPVRPSVSWSISKNDPPTERKAAVKKSRTLPRTWVYSRDGYFIPNEISEFRRWELAMQFADENVRNVEHEKEG